MFELDDFTITKREILVSICVICVMLAIGFMFHNSIQNDIVDNNEKYNKALKIKDKDLFEYGMRTNVGNAFVYGDLVAVDPVTYPEINGQYMYIKKVKEEYTRHTRQVCEKKGKQTVCRTEVYYTWDVVDSEYLKSKKVKFLDVEFNISKFDIPSTFYIRTIMKSSDVRYAYYGVDTKYKGTIFTDLRNGSIPNKTNFYKGYDIQETYNRLVSSGTAELILFWFMWLILTGGLVYGFYYLENNWLE